MSKNATERVEEVLKHAFILVIIGALSVGAIGVCVSAWISTFSGRAYNLIICIPLTLAILAGAAYGVAWWLDRKHNRL